MSDMEVNIHLLFFILLLISSSGSTTKLNIKGRIVAGTTAIKGQFPFFVILKKQLHSLVHGGGSLISADWVMTAAHVVDEFESVALIFGITNLLETELMTNMTSKNIYAHPGYKPGVLTYDIALVKLPTPVNFNENIQAISLPTFSMANDTLFGTHITVMGFGYTSDKYLRKLPNQMQYSELTVIKNDQCEKALRRKIKYVIACAVSFTKSSTCNGDSGGPAVSQDDNGNFMQVGIVSFGFSRRCDTTLPTGLTRLTSFLEWINEATGLVKM